jgi:3-isopropylmalate dehydrogenase
VSSYKVGVIGGDGIGPEVTAEALKVVGATGVVLDTTEYDLGADRFIRTGEVLPDSVLDELHGFDAILLGAIGAPVGSTEVPPGTLERGMLLRLRFALDLYINLRPFTGVPGALHPDCDFIVIRENTEGTYAGEGGFLRKGTPFEVATQGSVNTRHGVERCTRFAFALAGTRQRRHLTLVHKTNVLTYAGDLWQRTVDEVASDYPDVSRDYNHVDATCIYLVEDPARYDVIVTDNLFGDIITDLAGAVAGGIGYAASANLNPDRTGPSMFEPVHGAANDIAGTGKANPAAAIRSAALMLDFLGEADASTAVTKAVTEFINSTPEPTLSTSEIGDAIAERL